MYSTGNSAQCSWWGQMVGGGDEKEVLYRYTYIYIKYIQLYNYLTDLIHRAAEINTML